MPKAQASILAFSEGPREQRAPGSLLLSSSLSRKSSWAHTLLPQQPPFHPTLAKQGSDSSVMNHCPRYETSSFSHCSLQRRRVCSGSSHRSRFLLEQSGEELGHRTTPRKQPGVAKGPASSQKLGLHCCACLRPRLRPARQLAAPSTLVPADRRVPRLMSPACGSVRGRSRLMGTSYRYKKYES